MTSNHWWKQLALLVLFPDLWKNFKFNTRKQKLGKPSDFDPVKGIIKQQLWHFIFGDSLFYCLTSSLHVSNSGGISQLRMCQMRMIAEWFERQSSKAEQRTGGKCHLAWTYLALFSFSSSFRSSVFRRSYLIDPGWMASMRSRTGMLVLILPSCIDEKCN